MQNENLVRVVDLYKKHGLAEVAAPSTPVWDMSHVGANLLDVERIYVLEEAQRELTPERLAKIKTIAENFDSYKFIRPKLAEAKNANGDNIYIVNDGQGRTIAAAMNKIAAIPAEIQICPPGKSIDTFCAESFLLQTENVSKLTSWQMHKVAKNRNEDDFKEKTLKNFTKQTRDIQNLLDTLNKNSPYIFGPSLESDTSGKVKVDLTNCYDSINRGFHNKDANANVAQLCGSRTAPALLRALALYPEILPNEKVIGAILDVMTVYINKEAKERAKGHVTIPTVEHFDAATRQASYVIEELFKEEKKKNDKRLKDAQKNGNDEEVKKLKKFVKNNETLRTIFNTSHNKNNKIYENGCKILDSVYNDITSNSRKLEAYKKYQFSLKTEL